MINLNEFKNYLFSCLMFSLISCNQIRVITNVPYPKTEKVKTIALIPVVIGKIDQPIIPLIDAGMFNEKTNKLAVQILKEQKNIVGPLRDTLAKQIAKTLKVNVIYGDQLYNYPGYAEIKNDTESLKTEDKEFPILILPENEKMPLICKKGNVPKAILNDQNKEAIQKICTILNVDAIAVGYTKLSVIGAGMFGTTGTAALSMQVFIIYKSGLILSDANILGKRLTINGKKIEEYRYLLNEYPKLTEILIKDLAGQKYKPVSN